MIASLRTSRCMGAPVPAHARGLSLLQVYAVFGFCDIRQFTDATEVLQEDVMEFVNSISKIVHMEVSLHGGFPQQEHWGRLPAGMCQASFTNKSCRASFP